MFELMAPSADLLSAEGRYKRCAKPYAGGRREVYQPERPAYNSHEVLSWGRHILQTRSAIRQFASQALSTT